MKSTTNWTKIGQSMLAKRRGKRKAKRRAITGWKLNATKNAGEN